MSSDHEPSGSDEALDDAAVTAMELASTARERAYVPYSGFRMGAGIVGADGRTATGTLVENVSLGLAMCAERVALFAAVDQRIEPTVLAVASRRTDDQLTFPCGACLQVALEVAGPELTIVAVDPDGEAARATLSDLLPRAPRRRQFTG